MQRTPAGLPCGIPGIGEEIDTAIQHTPHPILHSTRLPPFYIALTTTQKVPCNERHIWLTDQPFYSLWSVNHIALCFFKLDCGDEVPSPKKAPEETTITAARAPSWSAPGW